VITGRRGGRVPAELLPPHLFIFLFKFEGGVAECLESSVLPRFSSADALQEQGGCGGGLGFPMIFRAARVSRKRSPFFGPLPLRRSAAIPSRIRIVTQEATAFIPERFSRRVIHPFTPAVVGPDGFPPSAEGPAAWLGQDSPRFHPVFLPREFLLSPSLNDLRNLHRGGVSIVTSSFVTPDEEAATRARALFPLCGLLRRVRDFPNVSLALVWFFLGIEKSDFSSLFTVWTSLTS